MAPFLSIKEIFTIGCFKNPQIRAIPVSDSTPYTLELLWIKRAGEPLSQTEKQFVQHLYHKFNIKMPDELLHSDISDTVIIVKWTFIRKHLSL